MNPVNEPKGVCNGLKTKLNFWDQDNFVILVVVNFQTLHKYM